LADVTADLWGRTVPGSNNHPHASFALNQTAPRHFTAASTRNATTRAQILAAPLLGVPRRRIEVWGEKFRQLRSDGAGNRLPGRAFATRPVGRSAGDINIAAITSRGRLRTAAPVRI
jgi:hypothetical protein